MCNVCSLDRFASGEICVGGFARIEQLYRVKIMKHGHPFYLSSRWCKVGDWASSGPIILKGGRVVLRQGGRVVLRQVMAYIRCCGMLLVVDDKLLHNKL